MKTCQTTRLNFPERLAASAICAICKSHCNFALQLDRSVASATMATYDQVCSSGDSC